MEKTKLFTTEDGIDIYTGDRYYSVAVVEHEVHEGVRRFFKEKFNRDIPKMQKPGVIAGPYINPKWNEPTGILKYFGKRENAENFVAKTFGSSEN